MVSINKQNVTNKQQMNIPTPLEFDVNDEPPPPVPLRRQNAEPLYFEQNDELPPRPNNPLVRQTAEQFYDFDSDEQVMSRTQ